MTHLLHGLAFSEGCRLTDQSLLTNPHPSTDGETGKHINPHVNTDLVSNNRVNGRRIVADSFL